jgi:hypothetical protein
LENRILETKVDNIFRYDSKVRFVAILTGEGEAVAEFLRPGVKSLEPDSETKMIYTKMSIAFGMTTPMDKFHGKMKQAIIFKERVTMLMYNLQGRVVMVSTEPSFQMQRLDGLNRLIESLGVV